ncbi:MAG: ferredoxin [Candidatus Aenigmatarchaeota archaeon]|nr:MAG: ferredoxin [Candidatus Aenigmarchaeota archaeon]RLJ07793.1 MAG: ferredoxin [Candidatus Aenigmarchaeota archaeon]RLJ07940.1 MAG: ferredoxin [Candidatus Aenigmarchaeota archaeon]
MIEVDRKKCLRCGGCVSVCPATALTLTEHGITVNDNCNNCGICVNFCPVEALKRGEK